MCTDSVRPKLNCVLRLARHGRLSSSISLPASPTTSAERTTTSHLPTILHKVWFSNHSYTGLTQRPRLAVQSPSWPFVEQPDSQAALGSHLRRLSDRSQRDSDSRIAVAVASAHATRLPTRTTVTWRRSLTGSRPCATRSSGAMGTSKAEASCFRGVSRSCMVWQCPRSRALSRCHCRFYPSSPCRCLVENRRASAWCSCTSLGVRWSSHTTR